MKICEYFVAHQGEITVGRLGLFLRLGGCNLACGFCDSKYHTTSAEIPVDKIYDQAKEFNYIVITGGEPLLQEEEVKILTNKLIKHNPLIKIEIETNGVIKPSIKNEQVQYNVSVKLTNSGNSYEKRINGNSIEWHIKHNSNFKFVVETIEDVDEVNLLIQKYSIPKHLVFLMPLGDTRELQLKNMEGVIKMAKIYGYNFSPRIQVLIFNKMRGV